MIAVVIHFATYNETNITPLSMIFVVILACLTFSLPLRRALLPLVTAVCLIPYSQRIVVASLDFDLNRIMLLITVLRLVSRNEIRKWQLLPLDKYYLGLAIVSGILPFLFGSTGLGGTCGYFMDTVLAYGVMRTLLLEEGAMDEVIKWLVLLAIPIGLAMILEQITGRPTFSLLGIMGLEVREGSTRAQAAFGHSILAGTFGGLVLPLIYICWHKRNLARGTLMLSALMSLAIVYASKSSGPLFGCLSGLAGLALWRQRQHVRSMRRAFWATLIVLHLIMKAPVWALIDRIPASLGLVAGSSSYHRYKLIDAAITNLGQWWLTGASLYEIEAWGTDLHDVTNQYIALGVSTGIIGTILLIVVLVLSFRMVGQCIRMDVPNPVLHRCAWGLGCLFLVHTMSFLGTTYFGGFWFFFQLSIAMLCGVYSSTVHMAETQQEASQGNADDARSAPSTYAYP
jgi:hypothetical protein